MINITVKGEIADDIRDQLIAQDISYVKNGNAFEISESSTQQAFHIGRIVQFYIDKLKYSNGSSVETKPLQSEDQKG